MVRRARGSGRETCCSDEQGATRGPASPNDPGLLDPTRAFTWIVGWLDRDRQSTATARRRGKFSALQSLENS